jgi:transcriptional antiterminator NusG
MIKNSKWYALFVVQGKEFYIADRLRSLVEDKKIDEVLLPTAKEIYEVRRKKIVRNITVYPGYLFIRANLDSDIQSAVLEVSFVMRFLGLGHALYIRDEEMEVVRAIAGNIKISSAFKYKIGDMVEIVGGHCKGLSGRVIDIKDINTLNIEIQIFNRAIYTNLKIDDVKVA